MKKKVGIYDELGYLRRVLEVGLVELNYVPADDEYEKQGLENAVADGVVPKKDKHKWTAKVLP